MKTRIDPNFHVVAVRCDDETLWVTLNDGRIVGAPIGWSQRLLQATAQQRANWQIIGNGTIIEWPEIDEHISARVLMGHPS